jgi:hypothetical protein
MKGDIILKVIIAFLIPFILVYSSMYFFYIFNIGFLSVLNCFINISIAYILFFMRFGKIDLKRIVFVDKMLFLLLLFFFTIIFMLLKDLTQI